MKKPIDIKTRYRNFGRVFQYERAQQNILNPILSPYFIFLLGSSELEVHLGNVLKAFFGLGLLEPGVEAVEG